MTPVVIVGGGLSGLAAGVRLSSLGIPVLLLEQRPSLGGRAYSFVDESTGTVIDNGQHVLIAGYARTMEFLGTIGTRGLVAVQPVAGLFFHHPERGFCSFRIPALRPPFHLLGGILTTDLLSPGDKARMLRAGAALRSTGGTRGAAAADTTIEAWLDALGQSTELKRSFWEPLAVAVMNEHLGVASANVFLNALRTAFLSDPRGAALAIPTVGLSDLYAGPARAFIERHGGTVRCGADVAESIMDGGRISSVRLRDGETLRCSALVIAVPSYRAPGLLPSSLREAGFIAESASIPLSPIVSIHLWFPGEFMPQEFLGVIGRRIQWVFNRKMICREESPGGHVSTVISAGHAVVDMGNEDIVRIAIDDLKAVYGGAVGQPTHAVVIREKRGTFSCTPAVEPLRPGSDTPVTNLFLAGDWTDTGYPATIEGAIMSGERSAGRVAAVLGGRR